MTKQDFEFLAAFLADRKDPVLFSEFPDQASAYEYCRRSIVLDLASQMKCKHPRFNKHKFHEASKIL